MTRLNKAFKQAEKFTIDNSPTILTVVGVTGTVLTAYLTGTASFKAAAILADMPDYIEPDGYVIHGYEYSTREKVQEVWTLYVPAIVVGTATVTCIIGANRIGTRRAAAMAAAYSLSERAFVEYREKVKETVGKNKERKVRDEIAQEKVDANPINDTRVIITGKGSVLCYELMTGRPFKSNQDELKKAENELNHKLLTEDSVSLSYFYDCVGLPRTLYSDEVGWRNDKLVEIDISAVMIEGEPALAIDYSIEPVRNFWKAHR